MQQYIALDENNNFKLLVSWQENRQVLSIEFSKVYQVEENLEQNILPLINIVVGEHQHKLFDFPTEIIVDEYSTVTILLANSKFAEFIVKNNMLEITYQSARKLSVFETRIIGRTKAEFNLVEIFDYPILLTDLHTHLSGQPYSHDLIEIGLKHNLLYPLSALDMLGLPYPTSNLKMIPKRIFLPLAHLYDHNSQEEAAVRLNELDSDTLIKLESALHLSAATQSTFEDIEKCYYLREPFTKDLELLPEILRVIANDYAKRQVKYAELSTNALIDLSWLKVVHQHMPAIEKETGVTLRFLIGIPRNLSEESLANRIEQIKIVSTSPYIVGVDLLGYEINKTSHIEIHLSLLANWIRENRPEFIFRIHAGENAKNPTNVKDALLFSLEHRIVLRIGHAVYGIDEQTVEIAKVLSEHGLLIIEFNPDSNLASNNIDFIEDLPIKKFLASGVKYVLGSDGAGLYQTDSKQLSMLAKLYGLSKQDFSYLTATEQEHINKQQKIFNVKSANFPDNFFNKEIQVPKIPLISRKLENKVEIKDYSGLLNQRIPILIAGATGSSWDDIELKYQHDIVQCLKFLVSSLNPNDVYFITGRSKDKGISVELGKIITLYNFQHDNKFLYASMVAERDENSSLITPKGISIIKEFNTPLVYLPSGTISFIKHNKGMVIYFGGRSFTRDFILESLRQNVNFFLMNGPKGASSEKARIYPSYSFVDDNDLHKILVNLRPEIFNDA